MSFGKVSGYAFPHSLSLCPCTIPLELYPGFLVPDLVLELKFATPCILVQENVRESSFVSPSSSHYFHIPLLFILESCLPNQVSTQSLLSNDSDVYQKSLSKQQKLEFSIVERMCENTHIGIFISQIHSDHSSGCYDKLRQGDRIFEVNTLLFHT
ncbi:hypothetical protein LOD99_10565 [Oopsacas minuta]|uniref:PDZ domain-containing protein n=1 Tax=Oopsacas minuta TaxID=111878 RepID=A0AAV7KGB8_9METZ|nr:hypothetical protein LOD99_10565 [Oopsacas minuta]